MTNDLRGQIQDIQTFTDLRELGFDTDRIRNYAHYLIGKADTHDRDEMERLKNQALSLGQVTRYTMRGDVMETEPDTPGVVD